MTSEPTRYTGGFYQDLEPTSLFSAKAALSIIFGVLDINSVVDFGCGTGSWLRAAGELGARKLTGVDGPWVKREMLVDTSIDLITANLESPIASPGAHDLAMSVEVAEHLTPARADGFVNELCTASSHVMFGAAIPGQGGTGHINEQWQSYWARKFIANGYHPLDIVRPQLHDQKLVNTWYRNNILLYVRKDEYGSLMQRILSEEKLSLTHLDNVIPDMFENPGLRHSLHIARQIPRKVAHSMRWRLRIRRWGI